MASDRTRKLAEEIAGMACCLPAGDIQPLLDAFERETRLDELRREWPAIPRDGKYLTLLQWIQGLDLLQQERIAGLAAQPTPEVKK